MTFDTTTTAATSLSSSRTVSAGLAGAPRLTVRTVERARVHAALDEGAPLTVVRGPAGSGKTTAVAQWASRQHRGAWLDVDRQGTDRGPFWDAVVQALGRGGHAQVLARWDRRVQGSRLSRDEVVATLGLLPAGTVVVIDDFGSVQDDEVARDLVAVAVANPGLRLVVVTRTRTVLESSAMQVHLDTRVVSPRLLSFDESEVLGYARACAIPLDAVASKVVLDVTGGLPIGVRTAVRALAEHDGESAGPTAVRERVIAALDRMTLSHLLGKDLDRRLAELLVRCGPASSFDVELARELTGWDDCEALIAEAEKEGLGMWSTGEAPLFTVSGVVRDALLRELEAKDPQLARDVRVTYAIWLGKSGRPFAGVRQALAVRSVAAAEHLVRRHFADLVYTAGPPPSQLLEGFSLLELRNAPLLVFYDALISNANESGRRRAIEQLTAVIMNIEIVRSGASKADRALMRCLESIALRIIGRSERAAALADSAYRALQALDPQDREELGYLGPILVTHLGLSFLYGGRVIEALERFREVEPARLQVGETTDGFHAACLEAGTLAILGDVATARRKVRDIENAPWRRKVEGYMRSFLDIAYALFAFEDFDADRIRASLDVLEPHRATIEHWAVIESLYSYADLLDGNPVGGAARLEQAIRSREGRSAGTVFGDELLAQCRFHLAVACGDLDAARTIVKTGYSRRAQWRDDGLAYLALAVGDPAEALGHLRARVRRSDAWTGGEVLHDLLLATAFLRLGRETEAETAMERAAVVATENGVRYPLLFLPHGALGELREAAGRLSRGSVAQRLFADVVPPVEMPDVGPRAVLTEREIVVLRELTSSRSAAQIAARLFVSSNTVKSQMRSLYRKLGVTTRVDAVAVALAQGLLDRQD